MTVKAILLSREVCKSCEKFTSGFKKVIGDATILKKFPRIDEEKLDKEIVDYIYSLQSGNRYKPLDRDTLYFSMEDGWLAISSPVIGTKSSICIQDSHWTLDKLRKAIRDMLSRKRVDLAYFKYAKNPTEANKRTIFKLVPTETEKGLQNAMKLLKL